MNSCFFSWTSIFFSKNNFKNNDQADNKASRAINQIIGGNIAPKNGQQKVFIRKVMDRAIGILSENGIDTDIASAQAIIWKPEQELYRKLGSRTRDADDRDYGTISDRLIQEGKYAGVIGVGGLLLAKIPEEIVQERIDYFAQKTQDRDDAIENDLLKDQHPSMPISKPERQSRVSFGGNRKT